MLFLHELGQLTSETVSENQAFQVPLRRHFEEEVARSCVAALFGDGRGIHRYYRGFEGLHKTRSEDAVTLRALLFYERLGRSAKSELVAIAGAAEETDKKIGLGHGSVRFTVIAGYVQCEPGLALQMTDDGE